MTERRRDPLTGAWRTFADLRPSVGPGERCPLCPTVDPAAATDVPWPSFEVAVLESTVPSLRAAPAPTAAAGIGVNRAEPAWGADELVVYGDDHRATLASLGPERARLLVDVWAERYDDLGRRDRVAYVLVLEDRTAGTGALSHPHGRIQGYPDVPTLPGRELEAARDHLARRGTCLQCDVVAQERAEGLRLVTEDDTFVAYVPFAARSPYEVHVAAKRHAPSLLDLSDPDRSALARILVDVVARYDAWFGARLPYVMAVHQAPTDDQAWEPVSHLHIEFIPAAPRAGGLPHLAASELGAGAAINDVVPEQAAAELRASR